MWRTTEDSNAKPASGASTTPNSSAQPPRTAAPQASPTPPAAVSQGIKIKGEISGQGDFFLDGKFEGSIRLPSGNFTVGPNARVSAEIEAREVNIRGELIGTLKACEHVHIRSTGKLTGNMETRGIVIDDGAVLHSKVAFPKAAVRKVTSPEAKALEVSVREKDQTPEDSSWEPRAKGAAGAS